MASVKKNRSQLISYIAEKFDVDIKFSKTGKRYEEYMYPRKTLCYMLYRVEGLTMVKVAKIMGYKDHTTVMYHLSDLVEKCSIYEDLNRKVTNVLKKANEIYETNKISV